VQFFTGLLIILFYPQFTFENSAIMNVGWQVATGMDSAWKAFIVTLLVIGWWSIIVWLWEKINFIGSFEWMIASISTIGEKIPPSSRLKINKVLYNVKPITYTNLFEKRLPG
jgi:hypothetical protein